MKVLWFEILTETWTFFINFYIFEEILLTRLLNLLNSELVEAILNLLKNQQIR